jgi:transcriptional regulator with XRE-family HTH domain
MTFGERLLTWRRFRNLTQAALSLKTGIPQPNIAALEGNRSDPKLSTMERLARALGISIAALLEARPPRPGWSRHRIDALVREAVEPAKGKRRSPWARALRVLASEKLAAAGRPVSVGGRTGERLVRQLRADLGPAVWSSVLRRLEKHL